jgi:uncharacterized protein YjbI with pentapeptide repeats
MKILRPYSWSTFIHSPGFVVAPAKDGGSGSPQPSSMIRTGASTRKSLYRSGPMNRGSPVHHPSSSRTKAVFAPKWDLSASATGVFPAPGGPRSTIAIGGALRPSATYHSSSQQVAAMTSPMSAQRPLFTCKTAPVYRTWPRHGSRRFGRCNSLLSGIFSPLTCGTIHGMRFEARIVGRGSIDPSQRVVLDHEDVDSADFSGRTLVQFVAIGSRLTGCRFDKTRIRQASFGAGRETSEYIECKFDGARIRFGPGGYSRFVRCSFREVDLRSWFCHTVEMVDCVFTGRLHQAVFYGSQPPKLIETTTRARNEFRGNDFSGIELVDVSFRGGIDLREQRLPSGPEYVYIPSGPETVHRAMANVNSLSEPNVREKVTKLLELLDSATYRGQQQLLLRKDTYEPFPPAAVDAFFELLRLAM